MVKPKIVKRDTVDEIIDELETAHKTIKDDIKSKDDSKDKPQNDDLKRNELLKLAEDGELDKSIAYIKKASQKVIDKLYSEYERRRMQKANEFLTDLVISKFSSTLGGFDAIESPEELENELKKDSLLRRDVYHVVESVSPFVPYLGFVSGGVTTAKHIYNHKTKPSDVEVKPTDSETNNDEESDK